MVNGSSCMSASRCHRCNDCARRPPSAIWSHRTRCSFLKISWATPLDTTRFAEFPCWSHEHTCDRTERLRLHVFQPTRLNSKVQSPKHELWLTLGTNKDS